jgi:hypothetical protein
LVLESGEEMEVLEEVEEEAWLVRAMLEELADRVEGVVADEEDCELVFNP